MEDSILNTIKKMVGVGVDYSVFDVDIIVLINSALSTLRDLGIGPKEAFVVEDETQKWKDYILNINDFVDVKEYIFLKVKIMFDPPSSSYVLDAYKNRMSELEWRLNVRSESECFREEVVVDE